MYVGGGGWRGATSRGFKQEVVEIRGPGGPE